MVKTSSQNVKEAPAAGPEQAPLPPVEACRFGGLADYGASVAAMEARVGQIHEGNAPECLWLLEHPPLYTAGTSAKGQDLLDPERFDVFQTGRGGEYTYHGPGQRVAYVMLDLKKRGGDVRGYVRALEGWIIDTLNLFGIRGERREGRVGIWVVRPGPAPDGTETCEEKIAAIGVRVRHWVSFHGISLNVDPDLEHFSGIVPCGIAGHGVTSLAALGVKASMEEVDAALMQTFPRHFGPLLPLRAADAFT